jgi:hypothetical protein
MLVPAVGAFKRNDVTAPGCGFVVSSFNTALVSTVVGITGVGGRANRAGGGGFFAELGWVAKHSAVAALGDEGCGEHLFAFTGTGEEANGVFEEQGLVWSDGDQDGGGDFHFVRGVRFKEASCVNGCSCCVTDSVPHSVEEVGRGGGEHVDEEIVNCIIGSGRGKVEGHEGVVFDG